MGRALSQAPAEGRPPGEGFSHQRWNEFYPQAYNPVTVTATDASGKTALRATDINIVVPDGNFKGTGAVDISDALKALRILLHRWSTGHPLWMAALALLTR